LLEGDVLALQTFRPNAAGCAIDDLWPVVRRRLASTAAGERVAAVGRLVFEDAIIEQINRRAARDAQERRFAVSTFLVAVACFDKEKTCASSSNFTSARIRPSASRVWAKRAKTKTAL